MRVAISALLTLVMLFLWSCSSSRSPRCKEICRYESRCIREVRELDAHFDETECIAACTVLDRDTEGRIIVDEHVACVTRAHDCEAVLQCR